MLARLRGALGKLSVDSMQKSYPVVGVTPVTQADSNTSVECSRHEIPGSEVHFICYYNYIEEQI